MSIYIYIYIYIFTCVYTYMHIYTYTLYIHNIYRSNNVEPVSSHTSAELGLLSAWIWSRSSGSGIVRSCWLAGLFNDMSA